MSRKFISFLLTIALVFGCMPLVSFADSYDAEVQIGETTLNASQTTAAGVVYDPNANSLTITGDLPDITYKVNGEPRPLTLIVSGQCTVGAIQSEGSLTVTGNAVSKLNINSETNGIDFWNNDTFQVVGDVRVNINSLDNGILADCGVSVKIASHAAVNISSDYADAIHAGYDSKIWLEENSKLDLSSYDDGIQCYGDLDIYISDSANLSIDSSYGIYHPQDYCTVGIYVSDYAKFDLNADSNGIYTYENVEIAAKGTASVSIDAEGSNGIDADGYVTLTTADNATLSINSEHYIALETYGTLNINAKNKSTISVSAVDNDGAYIRGDANITVSDSAKLNVFSGAYNGLTVNNINDFNISDNATASFTARATALEAMYNAYNISLQDNAQLSLVSGEGDALYIDDVLNLSLTGSAVLSAQAQNYALYYDYNSEITIGGNSTLSAVGAVGLWSASSDSVVTVSGGALDVRADDTAMDGGNLVVNGGSVRMIGYSKALNNLTSLTVEGKETTWSGIYDVLGVPFIYPSSAAQDNINKIKIEDAKYEIVGDIDIPVVLRITKEGITTIDAKNHSVKNLVLIYEVTGARVNFISADGVNCAVRIASDCVNDYYNDGNGSTLISGLVAEKCALELSGYTFYPLTDGLTIIKTIDAPFAVAAEKDGSTGKITKFTFYRNLQDAMNAASGSTVYVLNYYNTSDFGERLSYIDISQTSPEALSIEGRTFDTVLRMTNGVYSSFYVWDDGSHKWSEQYSNGPVRINAQDDIIPTGLVGNFLGSFTQKHIVIMPNDKNFTGLILRYDDEMSATVLSLTLGAILPEFTPLQKDGYELLGYYTDLTAGTLIIDANGELVSKPISFGEAELFDAEGKCTYSGIITLYAHWKRVGSSEVDENATVKIGDIVLNKDHTTDNNLPGIEYIPDTNTLKVSNFSKVDSFGKPLKLTYQTVNEGYALNILVNSSARFGAIESNGSLNIKGSGTLYVKSSSYNSTIYFTGDANSLCVEEGAKLRLESEDDGICSDADLDLVVKGAMYIDAWDDGVDVGRNLKVEVSDSGFIEMISLYDGFTVSDGCDLSLKDNAKLIIRSESDVITQNDYSYSLILNLSDRAELIAEGYWGVYAEGESYITIKDNAKADINTYFSVFDLERPAMFDITGNAALDISSLYSDGLYAYNYLEFTVASNAAVDISAGDNGIVVYNGISNIQIKDSSKLNIEAQYGINASYSDNKVAISGGDTNIKASYGISNSKLSVSGGKLTVTGYDAALKDLDWLQEDGNVVPWDAYSYPGSIYNFPQSSLKSIASVSGENYDDLNKAYAVALTSSQPIVILKNLPDSVSLKLTSDAAVTIDANSKNVSNLLLSYSCAGASVIFEKADAVKCTVCLEESCEYYYLNDDNPQVLIRGLNAAQASINQFGYSMYQKEDNSGLIAIATVSAPFAVAESAEGGRVTKFRFYKDINDAKAAASDAAIKDTIYVLNYENAANETYVSQVDITEQTTPDAVTLSGLTVDTVTRFTNGISSAFYTGKAGESNLQYTNGNSFTPKDYGNMTATLIGNFDTTGCTLANIVISSKGNLKWLTITDPNRTVKDVGIYMAKGAMIPNFALAHKDGYELKGYYTWGYYGEKLFVLDAKGQPITNAAINTGSSTYRFFDDNGGWSGEYPPYWDMTFYAQLDKLPEKDNGGGSGGSSSVQNGLTEEEYAAIAAEKFEDVNASDYYASAIGWALENNVTAGLTDALFGPKSTCSRAQVVTFLYRIAGEPDVSVSEEFTDVGAGAYYAKAISWALENGITSGYSSDKFNPNGIVTRAQFVTFLYRTARTLGLDVSLGNEANINQFTDKDAVSDFAKEAFEWAVSNGIVKGTTETTLGSKEDCLRGQVVTFLYRLFGKKQQ